MRRGIAKDDLFLIDGRIERLSYEDGRRRFHVDGIIRFHPEEFRMIDPKQKFLMHFNLESSNHEPGKLYALAQIVRAGSFDGTKEVQPVLSMDGSFRTRCISAKNKVSYGDLNMDDFRYSLSTIKSAEELKQTILRRYQESMSLLSDEDKLDLGIGMTLLEFVHQSQRNL